MKKRILSLLLVSIMLLTMLPTAALAAGAAAELEMHIEGGGVLSSLEGQVYGCWEARFYTSDGTTGSGTPIQPDSLELPAFLSLEFSDNTGLCCLKATGAGTGSISYEDANGTYTMPVTISLPDLGLYTRQPFDASSLVEDIIIDADHNVFYIALRPDLVTNGLKMTAVSAEFGPEVTGTNLTEIGTVTLSTDGSYAAVTVTDLTAEGHYHFEATVEDANSESASMKWGRSVWINNDMPRLYYCDLIQEESSWTVDYNNAQSDWWCCPGSGRPVCFYFGSRSQVESGNGQLLSKGDLSFPDYMEVDDFDDPECKLPNALEVRTTRFAEGKESTDIIYRLNDTEYKISAEPELPGIGFYTQPAASEDGYIYDGNPFVVTETNRTFYVCANDPAQYQLTGITQWYDQALAELFTVTSAEGGSSLKITVKDEVIVSNGYFGAEISYRFLQNESDWLDDTTRAAVFLKNGQPALMYRYLNWDNDNQNWYESEGNLLETSMTLSAGDFFPVQFYYGTSEENTKVELSDLTFTADILQVYMQDGAAWVKGVGFEESGTITYTSGDVTAAMNVNVTQPDFGFYSSTAASKATYFGDEVPVSSLNDAFYIVAGQGCTIPRIEAIRYDETGENVTDSFTVTIDENGGYARIQMKQDTDGNLPAGGYYTVLVEQEWGTRYLSFKLIRNDLPQLSTPTDLTWHRQYQWDAQTATDYEDRMGAMSFKVGELVQNRFAVEIYSAADGYANPVASGSRHFGDMDHSAYFSVTDFIYAELPSGTYKFRIRAEGDGTKYRDSEWSEMSDVFEYTMPSAQLSAPDTATFAWSKDDGHYFSTWQHTGETGTGYYEINWYYKDGSDFRHASAGCFDINVWDADADSVFNAMLPDELLEEHGNVNIYFCVRAIPADMTQYRISEWSDFSEALDVSDVTVNVNQKLDALLNGTTSSGQPITVEDVQTALVNETAELHTAMAADLELSGGPSSGTLEKIQALEKTVADTVDQEIEVKNSAPQQIQDIAGGITMIGATLNLADKHPESGTKPTVTLELDEPKSGVVIAEQQHNAVQFSMKLNGAIDKDDQEQAGQQLIVPVVIDMPVPAGINPDFLVVLHKLWNGTIEQIRPYIYWNEDNNCWHTRFVIDSFSDFALVEYSFRFETDSVTKVLGDATFTMAATGNADGSEVTYFSSDPGVAKVDPKTGRVTILKAGTVTITAIAEATDVYPEAQASYVLTVTASNASRPSENVPSTSKIQVEQPQNGAVSLSSNSAAKGDTVTITVMPDKGYTLETLTVTDENGKSVPVRNNGDGTYSFTQPAGKVTVTVTFAETDSGVDPVANPFTDVSEGAYYYDAVYWAVDNGITNGTSDTTYSPNDPCTRAQIVTFLWRAAGCPAPKSSEMPFKDVVKGSYYYDAVLWAAENGITNGTGDGTFSPDDVCSRAQIVTFLWRAQGTPVAGTSNPFKDVEVGAYYTDAVLWAVENNITNGTSATTFSPNEDCTRAQIVTFLYRYMK